MNPPQPRRIEPRHVLMTADTVGGVWTYALELCRGLKRHNVEVTLFTMGCAPDEQQRRDIAQISNVSLIPTDFRLEWMRDCEDDLVDSGELLLALEQKIKPDLIHVNGYWHAALPFCAPVLSVAHSCVPSWWDACRGTALPPEWAPYRAWVHEAILAADMVIAPTEAFLGEFQRLHGAPASSRVIWNGRDPASFRTGPKHELILSAGRLWDEAKNMTLLCKAARDLGIRVAVAGDASGPEGDPVELDDVAVLGKLTPDELAQWMRNAAFFVAPSRYEPFGLTILEAALSGCALVLGNIHSLRELWRDAAVFVDPDDLRGLRRILRTLADHPTRAAELGRKARARAETYSAARMADAYYDTYSSLVAAKLEAVA
jgi:glycosyltransferase involved in cell wall biosynthesis